MEPSDFAAVARTAGDRSSSRAESASAATGASLAMRRDRFRGPWPPHSGRSPSHPSRPAGGEDTRARALPRSSRPGGG
jgi:hypothetical protein